MFADLKVAVLAAVPLQHNRSHAKLKDTGRASGLEPPKSISIQ